MKHIRPFELHHNPYMLGAVKYSWVKLRIKSILWGTVDKSEILVQRKKDLRISEFQNLFDYYNFCDKNPNIIIGNNPIGNYRYTLIEWVWYLAACQLFPDELANATKRDLYTKQYPEILSMPSLTGDMEQDKHIFLSVIKGYTHKSESPTRQGLMLYCIWFKDRELF
jgi:hypothetical protein